MKKLIALTVSLLMLCVFSTQALTQTLKWRKADPNNTGGDDRVNHAMAYDSQRKVVVLFGGRQENSYYKNTREWDGTRWRVVSKTGPSARYGHAMAYDKKRKVVVMFGGKDIYGNYLEDLWKWNGGTWTQINVSGQRPYARIGHAMAYDEKREVVVMVGGLHDDGNVSPSTWEWNGSNWSHRGNFYSPNGPEPRYGHAMAYDSDRNVVLLQGGKHVDGSMSPSTWEWNGNDWQYRIATGPRKRIWHAMAYDSKRKKTVLFGGWRDNQALNDTWEWDDEAGWTQIAVAPPGDTVAPPAPSWRWGHAMSYDNHNQVVVLFGGSGISDPDGYLDWAYQDTWLYGTKAVDSDAFDLMVKLTKAAPKTVEAGDQLKLIARVKNKSAVNSTAAYIYFYLSPDKELDATDLLLGSTTVPAINKKKSKKVKKVILVPQIVGAGNYYIIAMLDVNDSNEDNNVKASKKTIKITG